MLHARTVQTNLSPGDMSFFPDPSEAIQRTFAMLKPDVVNRPWKQIVTQPEPDENGNEVTTEEIRANDSSEAMLQRIEAEGFTIIAKKRVRLFSLTHNTLSLSHSHSLTSLSLLSLSLFSLSLLSSLFSLSSHSLSLTHSLTLSLPHTTLCIGTSVKKTSTSILC